MSLETGSVTRTMPSNDAQANKYQGRHSQGHDQQGMNQGIQVLSYLIAGVLLYGGLGWLGDRYFETSFLLPIGIVLGAALSVYLIIRRFGQLGEEAIMPRGSGEPKAPQPAAALKSVSPAASAAGEEERWDR